MIFPDTYSIDALLELPDRLPPLTAGLIPEVGLGLIVAQPKTYKTTFMLSLSVSLAQGGNFLGEGTSDPLPILYILLEGTAKAAAHRLRQMGAKAGLPLTFCMDRAIAGNTEALDQLVALHKPRLVVIDTVKKFVPTMQLEDANSVMEHFAPLHEIAHKHKTFIYGTHHCNKSNIDGAEGILGSNAFYAEADALLYLSKIQGKGGGPIEREIILHGEFRDYEGLSRKHLVFDKETLTPKIKSEAPNARTIRSAVSSKVEAFQ